jgi:hypothetical protein
MPGRLGAASAATLVVALILGVGASSARAAPRLHAWAKFWRTPAVGVTTSGLFSTDAHLVKHVRPGTYRLSIYATDMLGFQLVGPGVNRHTRVALIERSSYETISVTWTIRLRRGLYQYRGIGPYAATSRHTTGSFRVS